MSTDMQTSARSQLIDKGCEGKWLDKLLEEYRGCHHPQRTEEFNELKREFDSLLKQLRPVPEQIEALGKMRLRTFVGYPLADGLAHGLEVMRQFPFEGLPQDNVFRTAPTQIRSCIAAIEQLQSFFVPLSVSKDPPGWIDVGLFLYCWEATKSKTPAQEQELFGLIADLINQEIYHGNEDVEPEAIRGAVRRAMKKLKRKENR